MSASTQSPRRRRLHAARERRRTGGGGRPVDRVRPRPSCPAHSEPGDPVIVTNGDAFRVPSSTAEGAINLGQVLFEVEPTGSETGVPAAETATASRSLRLSLAHGLHARPAARLAKAIGDLDAAAEIVAEDGRTASARSPVAMLGLGLRHGAMLTIQAGGSQAERAVQTLVDMLESGMGELLPVADPQPVIAAVPSATAGQLNGIAAVAGMAIGLAWRLKKQEIALPEDADDSKAESAALSAARLRVRSQLEEEAAASDAGAAIAAAHLAMIDDPVLVEMAERSIAAGKSAGWAWREALPRTGCTAACLRRRPLRRAPRRSRRPRAARTGRAARRRRQCASPARWCHRHRGYTLSVAHEDDGGRRRYRDRGRRRNLARGDHRRQPRASDDRGAGTCACCHRGRSEV